MNSSRGHAGTRLRQGHLVGNAESGHGLVTFKTKEQAQQAAQPINSNVTDGIKVISSDVYEIHAEADWLTPQNFGGASRPRPLRPTTTHPVRPSTGLTSSVDV